MKRFRFPGMYVLVIYICGSNRTISGAQIFKMKGKLVNLAETVISKQLCIETLNIKN